jgi:hypothetical protein
MASAYPLKTIGFIGKVNCDMTNMHKKYMIHAWYDCSVFLGCCFLTLETTVAGGGRREIGALTRIVPSSYIRPGGIAVQRTNVGVICQMFSYFATNRAIR